HTANSMFADIRTQASTLISNDSALSAYRGAKDDADMDSAIDAFQGFSFVSPWVDVPDKD
ncbi:hypothetical protein GQ54DRAFT_314339, partial [Martensiomyces pterosporus]